MQGRSVVFSVFAALWLASSPSWADDAVAAKVEIAKSILRDLHVVDAINKMLPNIIHDIQEKVTQELPAYKEKIARIMPKMEQKFQEKLGDFSGLAANIYADHFTTDELNEILSYIDGPRTPADRDKFMQSAVGVKFKSEQAAIMRELSEAGSKWGMKLGLDVEQEMKKELAAP